MLMNSPGNNARDLRSLLALVLAITILHIGKSAAEGKNDQKINNPSNSNMELKSRNMPLGFYDKNLSTQKQEISEHVQPR
jgi:hypothetical protein